MGTRRGQKSAALALVNQGIRQVAEASIGADMAWEFFCECGADDCERTVELTLAAYAAIQSDGGAVLASGHRARAGRRSTPQRG